MRIEALAAIVHEANRTYCMSINDHTQVPWLLAPEWQRASAIAGIKHVAKNPGTTPEELHEERRRFKQADGWVYGAVKDATAKTHPCMVPYSELPEEQRTKDILFHAIVRPFLDELEWDEGYNGEMEAATN